MVLYMNINVIFICNLNFRIVVFKGLLNGNKRLWYLLKYSFNIYIMF